MTAERRLSLPLLNAAALVAIVALALPTAPAHAHAVLTYPTPRDTRDDHKDTNGGAPCGIARTTAQASASLAAGSSITVKWNETIDHPGCFLVDFASANDANFQMLANVKHVATGRTPRPYTAAVTLPTTPCTACTLRVRQLMLANDTTACPPATIATDVTYYTCANVVLTAGDGGAPTSDAASDAAGNTDARADGGSIATGGATGTGSGGTSGVAGAGGSGGVTGSGGATGTTASGGAIGSGGANSSGGSNATASGGATNTGGASVGSGGSPGSTGGTGGSASATGGSSGQPNGTGESSGCMVARDDASGIPGSASLLAIVMAFALRSGRGRRRRNSDS